MKAINIFVNGKEFFMKEGEFLMNGEDKSDIKVEKIKIFFGIITINLSNGTKLVYRGHPYIIENYGNI